MDGQHVNQQPIQSVLDYTIEALGLFYIVYMPTIKQARLFTLS